MNKPCTCAIMYKPKASMTLRDGYQTSGLFVCRGPEGRQNWYTKEEILAAPMSPQTQARLTGVLAQAEQSPERWIEYGA